MSEFTTEDKLHLALETIEDLKLTNKKLVELVRDMLEADCWVCYPMDDCFMCKHYDGSCMFRSRAAGLGIEVDG